MKTFEENRPFIENGFQNAVYDPATGLDPDTLCEKLMEIKKEMAGQSTHLIYATAFAYFLDHIQLEINEHTPFAIKLNCGIDYTYFSSGTVFQKAMVPMTPKVSEEKLPKEHAEYYKYAKVGLGWMMIDFTHTVPGWNYLLEKGFAGILKDAEDSKAQLLASGNYEESQINFLDSVIISYQAILRLLNRIYDYSLNFNVPEFSACIKSLAQNPPQNLYEVMQFSIIYLYLEELGTERARTLGPIDVLYYPYFQKELENGKTEADVAELFRYYFIHFTAAKRYAEQPFTMCGSDMYGNDLTNRISHIMLDVYDELDIYDPKIHLRYHKNLDEKIIRKVAEMIRDGHNSICLMGDEAVYAGYDRIGVPREDSQNYVVLGCYEPIIMGKEEAEIAAMRFNTVKCVEFALNGGKDFQTGTQVGYQSETDIESFDKFFEIFLKQLDHCTDFALDYIQKIGDYSTLINPSIIYSSSFKQCIEQGKDVHEYPLEYNNLSLKHHGFATVVDSLVAIKRYVYDRKEISLDDLRTAIAQDWKGFEELQQRIIQDEEKYGNHQELPDQLLADITNHLGERYCGKEIRRGGRVRLGLDSVYHCIMHGTTTSATPDGRHEGKPISKNLCATDGMDREGVTACMQSVLKIDTSYFVDGVPFDFMIHPSAVEGEKGLNDFISLIKIFFANGGFAFQGNIVSGETLKDAQLHPEKYSTLQVRVCGWNEYFVKLSKVKQDLFIKQCEVMG